MLALPETELPTALSAPDRVIEVAISCNVPRSWEAAYHSFQNHYMHEIIIFELFR